MGLIFLISNIYIIVTILIFTGGMMRIPHLFRAFAPLYYLIGPLLYFYFQGALFSERISLKRDWFHFLPALIQFIDLIPFYFTSSSIKREMLAQILEDASKVNLIGEGFINAEFHAVFRLILSAAYLLYILISLVKSREKILQRHQGAPIFNLLFLIIVVFTLGGITSGILLYGSFSESFPVNPTTNGGLFFASALVSFLCLLFLHGYIFFMPDNIFRITNPAAPGKFLPSKVKVNDESEPKIPSIDIDYSEVLLSKLELGLKVDQWFKINGFTVEACAKKMVCEKYILSKLINSHYKMRFTDLINFHRVEFIKEEIKKGSTKHVTLEGLADEAGFNSRTTFYNAFIKHEGISPLEFLKSTLK